MNLTFSVLTTSRPHRLIFRLFHSNWKVIIIIIISRLVALSSMFSAIQCSALCVVHSNSIRNNNKVEKERRRRRRRKKGHPARSLSDANVSFSSSSSTSFNCFWCPCWVMTHWFRSSHHHPSNTWNTIRSLKNEKEKFHRGKEQGNLFLLSFPFIIPLEVSKSLT